jgi:hypothetical protein
MATTMRREKLPDNAAVLTHLLAVTQGFLDFFGPAMQQLMHYRAIIEAAVFEEGVDRPFFGAVRKAVRKRKARGCPSYAAILPYLDSDQIRQPLERIELTIRRLEQRFRSDGGTDKDARIYLGLCVWSLFDSIGVVKSAVGAVERLQHEILSKLTALTRAPALPTDPLAPSCDPPPEHARLAATLERRLGQQIAEGSARGDGPDPAIASHDAAVAGRETARVGPADAPSEGEWCFASSGTGYYIAGFGEAGHLQKYKGLAHIARLIKSPGQPVPMFELVGPDEALAADSRSQQPILDVKALAEIRAQLKDLQADLERAKGEGKAVDADMTQKEIDRLESRLRSEHGLGTRVRDLNNLFEKLRPRIHGRLTTVYKAMRKAEPSMKRLAEHFQLAISAEGGSAYIYRPDGGTPPWRLWRQAEK